MLRQRSVIIPAIVNRNYKNQMKKLIVLQACANYSQTLIMGTILFAPFA